MVNGLSGDVSSAEAYQLGPTFVRGFETKGIGPRLTNGEALGSTWYVGGSAEMEFPVPVLPESYGLSAAIWAEVSTSAPALSFFS